jgi:hypothetical protein
MRNLLMLSSAFFWTVAAAYDLPQEVQYRTESISPQNVMPTFDKGYLAVYEAEGKVAVFAPDGSLMFIMPRPKNGHITNVAVDSDGTVAAAVIFNQNMTGGISLFDRKGSESGFIDTGRHVPSAVCFGPDHSIWIMVYLKPADSIGNADYSVLHHYGCDGKELGQHWPRSSFDSHREPAPSIVGRWTLRIANNRIGALLGHGERARAQWVEGDLSGKEIGRWRADFNGFPGAFTANGTIYAQEMQGLSVLNRETGVWEQIPIPSAGTLLGADGEALVFGNKGSDRLRWVPAVR